MAKKVSTALGAVTHPALDAAPDSAQRLGLNTARMRLDALHAQSRLAAGSLIVTVFGDAVLPRGGSIWLGSLIGLLQTLGLNERLVRTAVFRLVKDEWLDTETQGRRANYHLTPTGQRRFDEASRHIYAASAPAWDQHWRLLMLVGPCPTKAREALRRAMRWQGFGELSATGFVHPGADLQQCLDALHTEGLAELVPQLMPLLAAKALPAAADNAAALVQTAWNLQLLAQDYREFLAQYAPLQVELAAHIQTRSAQDKDGTSQGDRDTEDALHRAAFVARTLMVHDFRRILLRDPELPAELLPPDWPGELARSLCASLYQQLLAPSEAFLDRHFQLANGEVPSASAVLQQRFGMG